MSSFSGWRLGAVMCKAAPFLQGVAVSASVNTLAAVAFDRYLAICRTLQVTLTSRASRLILVSIWVWAPAIMTPWAIYYKQQPYSSSVDICRQVWPLPDMERWFFLGVIFLTCYTIPLAFISAFYVLISCRVWHRNAPGVHSSSQVIHKSKVKVLKMMIVVVILFAFSWLPLYSVTVRLYFGPPLDERSTEFGLIYQIIVPVAQWLGLSNSCVNPIIYCFFSNKFRTGFKDLCIHCCRSREARYRYNSAVYRGVCEDGNTVYSSIRGFSPKQRRVKETLRNTFV
ncbi:hypothetical protein CAPTEDRAFT_120085 [Capitella teleta]|uniref:G-protein coupled receptors family 1 profile domain-containing protein n=1 Tax=Capitella teleta TaxID=283909 RepID=R7V1M0_CAPTE|nr:hypothetical protein CAPTEDRAFT_120085 [Capitella teleta]|eukprot:ELU12738.1 hypothetical protein CAPTEDRAFT_120085 [Capitella teleta]